mgnify:CR=1 FL=1
MALFGPILQSKSYGHHRNSDGRRVGKDEQLAAVLECLHGSLGTTWLVRFGPEMNGSWTRWGQQPTAYVEAFGVVSEALHAAGDGTAAVWSPVYGSGYPFGAAYGDVSPTRDREVDALDTDGSGDEFAEFVQIRLLR